jgi:hypothetical protein
VDIEDFDCRFKGGDVAWELNNVFDSVKEEMLN